LRDLLGERELVERYRDGLYVTLRLKANMYHRFHAPCDCKLDQVIYISGDTWNVNPIALKRVERLFCKNERVVLPLLLDSPSESLALVAVASILVASVRLHFLPATLDLRYRGNKYLRCSARFNKGDELGYFECGSTIVLLAQGGFRFADRISEGITIRVGEPLLRRLPVNAS
jgi:phosphatidylserine decarboxylase